MAVSQTRATPGIPGVGIVLRSAPNTGRSWDSLPLPPETPLTKGTPLLPDWRRGFQKPYRVLPPGGSGTCDPRLGSAQREKEWCYLIYGLGNPDDDNPADFLEPSDLLPSKEVTVTRVTRVFPDQLPPRLPPPLPRPIVKIPSAADRNPTLRKTLNLDVLFEPNALRRRNCTCAEEALQFYNQTHATEYQIVETLGSYNTRCQGVFWYHCNFRAVEGGHSPKLFFAELFLQYNVMYAVNCIMLDDPNLDIVHGCQMCEDQLSHPANLFQVGK